MYVEQCDVCQRNKSLTTSPAGLLQPLPRPDRTWEDISMDFNEGLPKSASNDVIFVVVDRLSKYAQFILVCHPFSAKTIATSFVKEVVRLHGFPRSIDSVRDKIFLSHFWMELFRLQDTQLHQSTTYHHQTDGQTEIVNKCVKMYLRCFCSEKAWHGVVGWHGQNIGTILRTTSRSTPPHSTSFTAAPLPP